MKKGTGKYKGKLPLKCFSCGKIGHFASKCPYAKSSDSDEDGSFKPYKKYNNYKNKNRGKFGKKKVSIQKEKTTHPVVTPKMIVAMTLMITVNQIRYSLWK